jgi:hypothetical protein
MFKKLKKKMGSDPSPAAAAAPPAQSQPPRGARPATGPPTAAAAMRPAAAADPRKMAMLAENELRLADMKEKLDNMEKNKKLLKDEELKLQRVENDLRLANQELLKVKDSKDATKKNRALINVKRLRGERERCIKNQDMFQNFINTLKDQIAAVEHKANVETFNTAAKPLVNEDELLDVIEDAKEAVQTQSYLNDALLNATISENYIADSEMEDLLAMAEEDLAEEESAQPDHIQQLMNTGPTPSKMPAAPSRPAAKKNSVDDELRKLEDEMAR